MNKKRLLFCFMFISTVCLSIEFDLDWEYNLPEGPDKLNSSWLANIDNNQNEEYYLSTTEYAGRDNWRINCIGTDGETASPERLYTLPQSVYFKGCKFFQNEEGAFLATLFRRQIDYDGFVHLVIRDFITDTVIDSVEIEVADIYNYRSTNYIESYRFNDQHYIFVGETVSDTSEDEEYEVDYYSLMHIFIFDGSSLELINTYENNGLKLSYIENENRLISIGKNRHREGFWDSNITTCTYFFNQINCSNLGSVNLGIMTSTSGMNDIDGNIYDNTIVGLSLVTYDENYILIQKAVRTGNITEHYFQKRNNSFNTLYSQVCNNGQSFINGKKIFYQGNEYILFFSPIYASSNTRINLLNYETGYIILTEETEISKNGIRILETVNNELKVLSSSNEQANNLTYRLYTITSLESFANPETVPLVTSLINNYPNPFNPTTTIEFSLDNYSLVELSVFNIKGQKIKELIYDELTKGSHSIIWSGNDNIGNPVSSGVYYYQLKINSFQKAINKCLLLK